MLEIGQGIMVLGIITFTLGFLGFCLDETAGM